MTLSVLMSVYKSEAPDYLDRSFQSIWTDQTRKPDFIVLIKDGPLPDKLEDIIKKWSDLLENKITILSNPQNIGLTKSLNKGIDIIQTDLIARMDSDDISDPLRFERQIKYLEEHPEIDVVGGMLREFDEHHPNLNIRSYPLNPKDVKHYIVKASPLAHPTVMMRRKIFDSGIRYNEKYRTCQDIALWFTLLKNNYQIANLPEITINFRRNESVINRRKSRKNIYNEFLIYCNGIYSLYGLFSWFYIYPITRLIFRLMPTSFIKMIYGSKLRKKLLK